MTTLLSDCGDPPAQALAHAGNAAQALEALKAQKFDLVLLDIRMPGQDGVSLARVIAELPSPPAVIFVTAHSQHAVEAFEVAAVDYLTKPVRLERLQAALQKAQRYLQAQQAVALAGSQTNTPEFLMIQDRSRTERLPLSEVIYFKAELKYVTVRTAARSYILDGSLNELEERYGPRFMRIHRNALIARRYARSLQRHHDAEEGEGWALKLDGIDDVLFVSRRQLAAVRDMLGQG
jgi:two-component system response regulator AlgR